MNPLNLLKRWQTTTPQPAAKTIERKKPSISAIDELPSVWGLEQDTEWLIDGLIAEQSVTLLTAESGTGKTWLAFALAGAIARGTEFLDIPAQKRPVLYVDGENPLFVVKRNLGHLAIAETDSLKVWGGWNDQPPPGPDNPLIVDFAKNHRGLIIYDSLVEFHTGDEQSSSETRRFMRKFRALAHYGATVIVLHHTGKSQGSQQYRGSSDIKAAVDTAYSLKKVSDRDGKLHQLSLTNFKARLAPGRNFGLEFKEGVGFVASDAAVAAPTPDVDILFEIIAENPHLTGTEIDRLARGRGLAKGKITSLLRTEADDELGLWERHRGDGNTYHYRIREAAEEAA